MRYQRVIRLQILDRCLALLSLPEGSCLELTSARLSMFKGVLAREQLRGAAKVFKRPIVLIGPA